MKKKTPIMLEHIGESGEWTWYAIFENSTPKKAIEWYLEEMSLDKQALRQENDGLYATEDDVRAYEIFLM